MGAESGKANDLLGVLQMHLKSAGNTRIEGPVQYQKLSRNEY